MNGRQKEMLKDYLKAVGVFFIAGLFLGAYVGGIFGAAIGGLFLGGIAAVLGLYGLAKRW
jgi:uncharacterized membrane protein